MKFFAGYKEALEACLKEWESNPHNRPVSNIRHSWRSSYHHSKYCPYMPPEYTLRLCKEWWFVELTNKSKVIPHNHPTASEVFIMCLSNEFELIIFDSKPKQEAMSIILKAGNYITIHPDGLHSAKGEAFILSANFR